MLSPFIIAVVLALPLPFDKNDNLLNLAKGVSITSH